MWSVATTDEFDEWFSKLTEDVQVELISKVDLLKLFGPKLARPHADTLNGSKHANMKELRAAAGSQVLRIAFAFAPDREAILLLGGDKSGVGQKQFYKQLIDKADRLYDVHLAKVKNRQKDLAKTGEQAEAKRKRKRKGLGN